MIVANTEIDYLRKHMMILFDTGNTKANTKIEFLPKGVFNLENKVGIKHSDLSSVWSIFNVWNCIDI